MGKENACSFLTQALTCLEYRGYDSCGVVTRSDGGWNAQRAIGPPSECLSAILPGTIGVGHTRWATHGAVTIQNTHPIKGGDDELFLVHNGIVENHAELRAELEAQGFVFKTETDTEALAHLLAHSLRNLEHGIRPLVKEAMKKVRGQYAFVALHRHYGVLICVSNGSPLYVTEQGHVASDPIAFAGFAEVAYRLPEGEVFLVRDGFSRFRQLKKVQVPDLANENVDNDQPFMFREILEQSRLVTTTLQQGRGQLYPEQVTLFGCGSSYNAALLGRHYINRILGIPATAEYATEMPNFLFTNSGNLWIGLTQSGETKDTLNALEIINRWGLDRVVLTNTAHSSAATLAEPILLECGPERGVAATKTFTMQCVRLYQLAKSLVDETEETYPLLSELGKAIDTVTSANWEPLAKFVSAYHNILYLGRGLLFPIAREGALKMMEVAYRHAHAMPASEMKHGPIAVVDECVLSIVLVDHGDSHHLGKILANIEEIRARGGVVLAVCEERVFDRVPLPTELKVAVPTVDELLQPLVMNVVLQLLAYHVATLDGVNVDKPKNLAKCVTV